MFRPAFFVCVLVTVILQGMTPLIHAQQLSSSRGASLQSSSPALQPDVIIAQKSAVQARIEALGAPDPANETQKETRVLLEQILSTVTAIEDTVQQQATFASQLEGLPQALTDVEGEGKNLATSQEQSFPNATEQLREEYQAQLQAAQVEVQDLLRQTAAGEVRIAKILGLLEQQTEEREQVESELQAARKIAPQTEIQKLKVEHLEAQLQLQQATSAALAVERQWLVQRIPLQDARLEVTHLRLRHLQRDLSAIRGVLGQAVAEEQAALSDSAADLTYQIEQAQDDPVETLLLTVSLETIEIRRNTAADRQQLNAVRDAILEQEKHNAQIQTQVERLSSLAEKYTSGEVAGQRLLTIFERLQHERTQYERTLLSQLDKRIRLLNERLFALDDQLYDFDEVAEARITELAMLVIPEAQQDTYYVDVRALLAQQKSALRAQQQIQSTLGQDMAKLASLHRDYKRQIDDGYVSALTKVFWIRNAEPLNWGVVRNMLKGALEALKRLAAFSSAELTHLHVALGNPFALGGIVLLVFGCLPWGIVVFRRTLQSFLQARLDSHAQCGERPSWGTTLLMVVRSATWPAYIVLIAWLRGRFFPGDAEQIDLALVQCLQLSAFILWVALFSRGFFRRNGWAQAYWDMNPNLCGFLQRAVYVISAAALVCLIPRSVLLIAPGSPSVAVGSYALARFLFLGFQVVVLLVVGCTGLAEQSSYASGVGEQSRKRRICLATVADLLCWAS